MTTNPILRFCPVLPLFALLPLALRAVQVEFRMAPYDDPAVTVEERSWDRPKYAPVNTAHGVELQVVGRDYACWARNVKLDGRPVFERYHGDRYVDRAPRARADVAPGEHVLWPGNHVFSVAEDGALSTEDPSLRVEEGVVTILAWPVAIKSLLANAVDPALPEAMRMASIPNLAVRDSSEQEKDEAALAAWEASGGEGPRPGSSASELLPAFGDFAPLVIWLPANTEGNGYRLHPIGQSFTLDADGVHASFVGDEPPVPGLDIAGFTVSIPLYRFPVHGDPGTRLVVSGVEAYDFTDRRPDSGTRWYPRRRPYEVLAGQEAQPIRIDGDLLAAPFKALAVYNTTTADGSQCVAMVEHAGRHFRPGSTARFRVQAASGGGTNTLSDAVWRVACREFGSSVETDLPAAASPGDGAGVGLEVAIPDSLPDGVYEFLFRALPSEGGAPQAEVATRATVARPADFAAGVFTPRGRTAFYRGEDFWLGLGALSTDPDRPLPAGQPLALELVDPRGNVHPLFSEPLPADVGARATRIVRVDAQRSFDFAAGRYVLRPALGPAAGRERTIDIVDPEPESHFTTLQTGKYNSQGTEYANLLRSGDRAFAEDVVREMREAGVNAFMGMTYDFDRVVFPDADVEQLVRERPELGPWECWFQPSGRDRFLDACVRHNLRFWENLFTYNDTSLPRGARIRAGSARFAGLETHSLRYSPAFQGVCLYDEIYSRSGDDGLHVGNDFDTSTEMEYREAYPGRTGAQAAKALERFASRPAAQRSADDLDYARSWVAWEDEMWTRWCHAIVRPVREVAPFSRNFVLNRYWGGNGGNIAANGYEKGIFDELDIAACVMYKDGGYGDRPVFAPMQADVLRVRPGMPVWTQIHDFNGPGVNGRHLLRQAFLALGQKVDGFTFFCTSFPTDDPAQHDHQWNVANIARELCLPYGDFFLSLDKGYRKVAVYYSRTAAFMGARKANSLGHQCELLWVACLRAGFPADYIRDEDLLEGRADGYEAIFVPGFTYEEECPEALLKELRRLVSAGVVVLVEKSSKLPLEGAVRLQSDLDEYEDRLGGAFPRYIDYETEVVFRRSDETTKLLGEVLPRHVEPAAMHDLPFGPDWQTRGQGHYLFAANYSPVGFRGLSMTLYQAPRIASMAFPPRGPVCYDLLEMRRIDAPVRDDGLQHVDVDMRRSPGKILAFLPEPVGGVLLRAPATLSVGGNLPCTVSVAGESGAPIDASFPVELTLVDPEGKRPYHVFRAAAPELRASWRLPANVPAGNWTLEARELLSGKTARATIEVKAASRAAPDAPAEKGCRVEDEDRIRAFLGEIRETEAVIPVEPDRPDLHAAATAFARRLAAKGCRARVEIVTDVVRPPVPLDPRNPQLDGTRLWRGTPVNPAQFLDAPCIVFGGRRDNRLLATLAARAVFDQSPSEAFPGPGRGFLAWVRGAFSIGYDTLVVSGADPEALDQAVDALLAFEPADVPARPPVAEAYAKGVGSDTVRPPEPIDIPAMAGRIDLSPPAAPADSAIAPAPAAEPRPENRTEAFLGDDMVMALDVDPATGRALVGTYGYGTNLFCIAADGTVEWSAFLPEFDVYRASWCDGGRRVAALTGRGWYVFVLDGATGGILARSSATEWPDTHWTEGCVDTHVALADNRPARQLLVCGRTGLLAMDYDGRPLWFHDLAGEIATYPEEAEKSGAAAIFPRNARVGSAVASPDGTRIALSYYRNIGTTMDQTKQVDLWGFRPCVLDAATGQRLCISTNDPGMEMSPSGWTITWPEGSGNPLVWYHGFARQGQPIAAELLPDGQLGDWLPRASHNQTVEAALDRLPREVARTGADGGTAWRTATRYAIPRLDALSADGSRLYRSGRDGFVQCIDLANGAIPWSTPVGASARLVPLADGGVLAGTLQGRVVRLGGDGATAWTLDLRRLQELPGRDYPDVVRDAVVRDALKHHVPFPSRPERPGDLDGILRFGVEHATNGSFEEDGAWEPAPADGVEPDGGGDAPVLSAPAAATAPARSSCPTAGSSPRTSIAGSSPSAPTCSNSARASTTPAPASPPGPSSATPTARSATPSVRSRASPANGPSAAWPSRPPPARRRCKSASRRTAAPCAWTRFRCAPCASPPETSSPTNRSTTSSRPSSATSACATTAFRPPSSSPSSRRAA
ncbi:MAG: hypothetical protein ACOX5G_00250 [Kiritimatiellia bacterium]